MSISQNFPNTRPSLNLNFARSKTLDPRISFIRTQTGNEASYVDEDGLIKYAATDEPRFDHDPVTGECLGLIIEEQRTNLFQYSTYHAPDGTNTDFNWRALNGAVSVSTTEVAPDGTNTAWRWDGNSGNGYTGTIARVNFGTEGSINVEVSDTYTVSFYAKHVSGSQNKESIRFDFNDTLFVKHYGDDLILGEWVRIVVSGTLPAGTYTFMDLLNNITTDYVIDFWGIQIEKDKDVSSYIPTSGSTVTRNSDNVWIDDITDFFNPNEGTAIITYRPRFDGVYNTPFRPLFSIRNTTTGRSIGFDGNSNDGQLFFDDYTNLLQDDGGRFTWLAPETPSRNRTERVLVSYANTYFRMYQDSEPFRSTNDLYGGGKIDEYFPSLVEISTLGFNAIIFGSGTTGNSTTKFNYTLQQFIYYPSEVGVSNAKTLSKRP